MDSNPPSSGDYALSDARDNATSLQDCMVLIGWLAERVTQLEGLTPLEPQNPVPELPSKMLGFACYPRRDAAVRDAMMKIKGE